MIVRLLLRSYELLFPISTIDRSFLRSFILNSLLNLTSHHRLPEIKGNHHCCLSRLNFAFALSRMPFLNCSLRFESLDIFSNAFSAF